MFPTPFEFRIGSECDTRCGRLLILQASYAGSM
jgi:hypothetical protein